MESFCSTCGKPLGPDARFCGSCGAGGSAAAAQPSPAVSAPIPAMGAPPAAAPVASGSSALKIVLVVILIGGAVVVMAAAGAFYFAKRKLTEWKNDGGVASNAVSGSPASNGASSGSNAHTRSEATALLLTKEEVGEIIGVPVTAIEMSGKSDANYKTATMGLETSIEVEIHGDEADAIQSMDAARTVTRGAFGGKADTVAGLGDDAVYGANNVLYARKGDVVLTIQPPNLRQAAQMAQHNKMMEQPLGSDAQLQEMKKFQEIMKGDAAMNSLSQPNAVAGAADLIRHSATEQGDEYETKSRAMARQMAEKVLSKIST